MDTWVLTAHGGKKKFRRIFWCSWYRRNVWGGWVVLRWRSGGNCVLLMQCCGALQRVCWAVLLYRSSPMAYGENPALPHILNCSSA